MAKKHQSGGGFNVFTALISTAMVLILLGTLVFCVTVGDNMSRSLRENFSVDILLTDSITVRETNAFYKELKAMPAVKRCVYISKKDAAKELEETLGYDSEEFLGYSPFPASMEIFLNADYACQDSLTKHITVLKQRPYVADTVYPENLIESLTHNIRIIAIVLLSLVALLVFIAVALINNTMRLALSRHRFSIRTMKLVGASHGFIRRPYMRRAFWIGFIAALIACGVLLAGMQGLIVLDEGLAESITPLVMVATLGIPFVAGIVLTMVCAYFSVSKLLRLSAYQLHVR